VVKAQEAIFGNQPVEPEREENKKNAKGSNIIEMPSQKTA
jgi:hypothetical protein